MAQSVVEKEVVNVDAPRAAVIFQELELIITNHLQFSKSAIRATINPAR